MKHTVIKLIDFWAGNFLCFCLTLLRKASDYMRGGERPHVKRVMFIKMIEQGATVLAYSSIKQACDRYGRENVFFCVFKENRPILDFLDLIPAENVIELRNKNLMIFAWDFFRLMVRTRRESIDATIDMEFFTRAPAILAFLSGATTRVGLHRFTSEYPYRGDLMTHRVQYNPYIHTAKGYLCLVEALERDPKECPMVKLDTDELEPSVPSFVPTARETAEVERILEGTFGRPPGKRLVILNPNASDMLPLRKWPTERFLELAQRLLDDDPDLDIVLTGAPSEAAGVKALEDALDSSRVRSVAGKTTLRQVIVLYTLADLLITNDSGPGHFSSMTDINAIVLFGPETPELFGSLSPNCHFIWKRLACSPCVNVFNHRFSPCTNNVCMDSITVEDVRGLTWDVLEPREYSIPNGGRLPNPTHSEA